MRKVQFFQPDPSNGCRYFENRDKNSDSERQFQSLSHIMLPCSARVDEEMHFLYFGDIWSLIETEI